MDDLLTTRQVADRLGLKDPSRVRQLVLEGKLPAQKVGRDLLIKASDLKLVKNRPKVGRPPAKVTGGSERSNKAKTWGTKKRRRD